MGNKYFTVEGEATGEITEKKSRFICNLYHIESEEDIIKYTEALRKTHFKARHVCYAAILGDSGDILKYSDDGEPSGTAGRPMLDILKGRQLTYTLACVTRYFGGVLLGTGGLVRAYSDALQDGLHNATIVEKQLKKRRAFATDYQTIGKIKYKLEDHEAVIISEEYGSEVNITLALPEDNYPRFIEFLTELSNGKIDPTDLGSTFI